MGFKIFLVWVDKDYLCTHIPGSKLSFFAEHGMLVRLGQGLGVDKTASVPNQPAIPNTVSDFLSFAVCNLLATRFPSPSAVRIIA